MEWRMNGERRAVSSKLSIHSLKVVMIMTNNLERLNALQDAYNKINAVANTKRFKHSDPQLYLGIRVALDEVRKLISIESKKIATYHK